MRQARSGHIGTRADPKQYHKAYLTALGLVFNHHYLANLSLIDSKLIWGEPQTNQNLQLLELQRPDRPAYWA